jgi:hypothetical protein
LPIAILVPIRIRIENPQIFPSWESPYDSAKRENALALDLTVHDWPRAINHYCALRSVIPGVSAGWSTMARTRRMT